MCTLCIDDHFSETQINWKVQRTSKMLGGKQYWHNSTLHFISYQLFLFHCKTSGHLIVFLTTWWTEVYSVYNHRAFPFVCTICISSNPRCCTAHQLEAKCVSQYCTGSAQRISALKDKKNPASLCGRNDVNRNQNGGTVGHTAEKWDETQHKAP